MNAIMVFRDDEQTMIAENRPSHCLLKANAVQSRNSAQELRGVEVTIRIAAITGMQRATEIASCKEIALRQDSDRIKFEAPPFQVSSAILRQGFEANPPASGSASVRCAR